MTVEYTRVQEECGANYFNCKRCEFWTEDVKRIAPHYIDRHFDISVRRYTVGATEKRKKEHFNERYPCWVGTELTDYGLRHWLDVALRSWKSTSHAVEGNIVTVACRERQLRRFYCCFCGLEALTKAEIHDHLVQMHVCFLQRVCKKNSNNTFLF
jgi:hypothetical protein